MSDYLKDMFIDVRKKKDIKSTISELESMLESVSQIVYGAAIEEQEGSATQGFSVNLSLPRLTPTESWGDPNSQSRQDIDRIFASIIRQPSIKARIEHINSFADPKLAQRKGRGARFNSILNMMMILEALQACLNDYSESSAGFVFEGFMAAVTGGKQIAGRVGGTLPIEDFVTGDNEPVSLKLLSPKTKIHGSFTNLVDYLFIRGGTGVEQIKYLIGRKNTDGDKVSQLMLLEFVINRQNFVEIMSQTGNGDLLGQQGGAIQKLARSWSGDPKQLLQMREVLLQTPGYNQGLGMFVKNLDDAGQFNAAASAPKDPAVKQAQYQKELERAVRLGARTQGKKDADEGKAADFESWAKTIPEYKDADKLTLNAAKRAYAAGYSEGNPAAAEQQPSPEQVTESYFGEFHEREKYILSEEKKLMEASGGSGGKQWSISAAGTEKITNIAGVDYYGEINLSDENIKACTDIYISKLGDDLINLLQTTKEFTENIGKYFSTEERAGAMSANQQAQEDGKEVVQMLQSQTQDASSADEV